MLRLAGVEFLVDECVEQHAFPAAFRRQAVCARHRTDAPVEPLGEAEKERGAAAGLRDDGLDIGRHIFHPMVEFGHQQPFLLPCPQSFARRRIDPPKHDFQQRHAQGERRIVFGRRPGCRSSARRLGRGVKRLARRQPNAVRADLDRLVRIAAPAHGLDHFGPELQHEVARFTRNRHRQQLGCDTGIGLCWRKLLAQAFGGIDPLEIFHLPGQPVGQLADLVVIGRFAQ